jgi:hypothetical protein
VVVRRVAHAAGAKRKGGSASLNTMENITEAQTDVREHAEAQEIGGKAASV